MIYLKLILVHFILDFPGQGQFLSEAKNHTKPFPGIPWQWAMVAHSFIQAGGVWLVTGSLTFAIAEFLAHFVIDFLKCSGKISFSTDQILHIFCKLIYAIVIHTHVA
ncbi:MAG TPA: DUF3307 domain-containing protein [Leptospiraceae bacterium]|nr:DUF3307 domain-containing protein [Leptospiraceae bacterium]